MNLKKIFFRNKELQSVDIVEVWEVRWESRYSGYHGGTQPEMCVFPNKKDAQDYKKALKDAFELIRHTSGTRVNILKQRYEGKEE